VSDSAGSSAAAAAAAGGCALDETRLCSMLLLCSICLRLAFSSALSGTDGAASDDILAPCAAFATFWARILIQALFCNSVTARHNAAQIQEPTIQDSRL
jgi:hypothetical protein